MAARDGKATNVSRAAFSAHTNRSFNDSRTYGHARASLRLRTAIGVNPKYGIRDPRSVTPLCHWLSGQRS